MLKRTFLCLLCFYALFRLAALSQDTRSGEAVRCAYTQAIAESRVEGEGYYCYAAPRKDLQATALDTVLDVAGHMLRPVTSHAQANPPRSGNTLPACLFRNSHAFCLERTCGAYYRHHGMYSRCSHSGDYLKFKKLII